MTSSTTAKADQVSPPRRHVGLALTALALGGFTIGTTEFVTMGLLPDIAEGIHEDIATTGHVITAYAFGVVVGAPLLVSFGARLPKKGFAIALVLGLAVGNALTAVASGYLPMLAARFVAGLPHGAFFGVASLLAASMVDARMRGRAISMVMMGLSVGTVLGVPISTFLGQHLGWRSAYWLVVALAILAAALIWRVVAQVPGMPEASARGELAALKRPQVLLAFATGAVGFGGLFAMYSYIAPIVTDVADLPRGAIPWFTLIFGLGSVVGTWAAGRLADWNNVGQIVGGFVATIVTLLLFATFAEYGVIAAVGVFVIAALGSVVAIGLQIRLMVAAGDAQMLGAAINHSSLNLANGLGAWLGGVVITAGWGYTAPSLVGAGLAAVGLAIFAIALGLQRRPAVTA